MQSRDTKRLYTVTEAAHYLGIPAKRIYNAIGRKAKPEAKALFPVRPKKQGKYWLFERKDLDAWADSIPYSRG